jgi:hypothetical protein
MIVRAFNSLVVSSWYCMLSCVMLSPVWSGAVEEDDYLAALSYLTLKYDKSEAVQLVKKLRAAKVETTHTPTDVLRSCRLLNPSVLPKKDPGVQKERDKLKAGKSFSPILVVSYPIWSDIADGFHRTSYCYHAAPTENIPMKVVYVELPAN